MNKDTPILITGATGFVGSYVVRQLWRNGYQQLTGLRRANSSLALLGEAAKHIQWVTADITDYFAVEDALAGQSVVIHCAAKVSFQPGDQKVLFRTNRDGTRHLVDASLHHGVQYFLYLSSVAALGRKPEGFPTDEDTKWEDGPLLSQYARSKFFAELEVWRGQAEGLAVGVLYPSTILGAGFWDTGTGRFFRYVDRQPTYYPSGSTGMIDVRDVAAAVQLLLDRNEDGERYLLNAEHLSYQDLLTQIAKATQQRPPSKLLPRSWAFGLAVLERIRAFLLGTKPLLTRETARNSYQNRRYDNQRSRDQLGISYRDLAQTIRETAAVYQKTQAAEAGILPIKKSPTASH